MLTDPIQQFTSLWEGGCGNLMIQRIWTFGPHTGLTHAKMQFLVVDGGFSDPTQQFTTLVEEGALWNYVIWQAQASGP